MKNYPVKDKAQKRDARLPLAILFVVIPLALLCYWKLPTLRSFFSSDESPEKRAQFVRKAQAGRESDSKADDANAPENKLQVTSESEPDQNNITTSNARVVVEKSVSETNAPVVAEQSIKTNAEAQSIVPLISRQSPRQLSGFVKLSGTPPAEKPVDALKNDPNCGRLVQTVPTTRFYVVNENGGLADTVVYLESSELQAMQFTPSSETVLLDNRNCEYVPYIFALQTGQKLFVRNSDPIFHNVHTTPTATGNRESNKAMMPKAPDLEFTFASPESFLRFKCDVHPWMFAYASVFTHPFFSVSDANGAFILTNVPPGKYILNAEHRKAGKVFRVVDVREDKILIEGGDDPNEIVLTLISK